MASPFQKPVGALRSRLLAELSTVEQSRQAVDDLIFSAEAHLASLIEERYKISREIEGRKANLSSINYVPFEILGNIFIQVVRLDTPHNHHTEEWHTTSDHFRDCAHDRFASEGHQGLDILPGGDLFRLQLVCRRWTDIVNSFPSLWGELHLVCPDVSKYLDSYKRLIDRHMIRSRASSLYISFTPLYSLLYSTPPSTTRKEETAARELLSYLALYASERWKVFSLCWKEHFSLNDSNQAISTILSRATHLEHLTFHHDLERYRNTFFTMQSSTVNLRHLTSLAIIDTQWSRLVFASPLPSVQYLTLGWNRGCCWASLMYTRACGVKESAMDHSFQSEYDCVHWLSLFPTLQSLHLVSHQEESEYVSPFHPHISNASGINGPQPVSGTSHAMANDLYDRMHSPPFYEARRLHTMILEGPVPAWVLHGTLFSSLRTLKIISNRRGVNVWEKGRQYPGSVWDWRDVDLSATTELVLDCGGSEFGSHKRPFWRIQDVYNGDEPRDNRYSEKKETVDTIIQAFISNSKNQGYIRDTFDALPNLKVVKAPSCVWKVIKDSFCIPGTRGNIASLIAYATCGGWNTAEDFTSDGEKSYQDEDFSHLYRDYDINESEPVDREVISSEEIQEPSTEPFDPCLGPFEIPADIVRAALGTVVLK